MSKIDTIILQHSTRGMDKLYAHYKTSFCKNASESFYGLKRGVVFIYTGFWANGKGETDGPVGAYFLYKGFEKLGFSPLIISDEYCLNFFLECKALHVKKGEDTKEYFSSMLQSYKPIAHFSIERLGRDKNGFYKNVSGRDIREVTPKLDILFEMATTLKYAIGDGGNEIGMGNFKDFLENSLHVNPCVVRCDFPIVASVSNWGAYGFLSSLTQLSQQELLPTFHEVERYLKHIVSLGSTDGLSGKNILSVDGKGYMIDKEILQALRALY